MKAALLGAALALLISTDTTLAADISGKDLIELCGGVEIESVDMQSETAQSCVAYVASVIVPVQKWQEKHRTCMLDIPASVEQSDWPVTVMRYLKKYPTFRSHEAGGTVLTALATKYRCK